MQTSAEVDVIAGEIVPQLQQHTEQLTNIFALIDKMSEHVIKVSTQDMCVCVCACECIWRLNC
jgi:hypothetical protein